MTETGGQDPYVAAPPNVDLADCAFYHVMDLPGHPTTLGEWDLRGHEADYLGHIDLAGKRVLEVGPASGHLTFWMESQHARVVAYDLGPNDQGDLVPYAHTDQVERAARYQTHRAAMTNAWWYAHQALDSHARLAQGSAYRIPAALGTFDVTTFAAVLLHLRDPFLALQQAAALTSGAVVVTDVAGNAATWWRRSLRRRTSAHLSFLPDDRTGQPDDAWWALNPEILERMLAVLGFDRPAVTYHHQRYLTRGPRDVANFTVIAHRRPG